jgi:hypothetical protein
MTDTSYSAFPVLSTPREWSRGKRGRPYHVCGTCRLAVDPRNSQRHQKACAARKRANPERWRQWRDDMFGVGR